VRIVIALLIVTVSAPAQADFTTLGLGALSCGSFLNAVAGQPLGRGGHVTYPDGQKFYDLGNSYSEWVQGFISAINTLNAENAPPNVAYRQLHPDYPGLDGWLRKFCDAHPTELFATAVWNYVIFSGAKPSVEQKQDGAHRE
jgi:hypothetical protein